MFKVVAAINSLFEFLNNVFLLKSVREKTKYGSDYYFEEYNKQITVYRDGHGILSNAFRVKVLNPKKFAKLRRKLNISDGKDYARFKSLNEMELTDKSQRFNELGFWYCSENNIISNVKEFYFSDADYSKEDKAKKSDPKELRWIFNINSAKIKKNKTYSISYAISVPGMFPIADGMFDDEHNPFDDDYGDFSSSLTVTHAIKKVIYTVAIEKGIKLSDDLKCTVIDHAKDGTEKPIPLDGDMQDNVFYDKYTYVINNPHINSCIKINWNVEHNKLKAKEMQEQETVSV